MTDARLPGRWLTDPAMETLTDRLWRIHTAALMWCAEQGTDGRMPLRTLRLLHPDGATADDGAELVRAGLWVPNGDGYAVADWGRTQSLAADIEAVRAANRERQARHRARRADADVTRDVTHDVTRESRRQGEERLGPGVSSSSRNGGEGTPPPSTCSRHPNGTDAPCAPCGRARRAREEWDAAQARMPKPPRPHVHRWTADGTCTGHDGCLERREDGAA